MKHQLYALIGLLPIVNLEILVWVYFYEPAKFRENKTLSKWLNHTVDYWCGYCKFCNFREVYTFAKLCICEVLLE